jgi:beta-galactosidase
VGQNYRENELLAAHAQKPTRKILGTENGMDRAVWLALRDHPAYSGQFLWAGADYLGESGGWPRIGFGAGLIDRTGLVYARGYERQSWWSETPNVHIVRRIGKSEQSAIDPGYEATPPRFQQVLFRDWTPHNQAVHQEDVEVYTNADEVELQLNGKSLGIQQRHADASALTWQVEYSPGTLKAVAYKQGKPVASDVLRTAGKPVAIRLTPERTSVTADPEDVVYVDADVVDDAGTMVPDATERLHFSVTGPAQIVGVDNGSGIDHDSFQADNRRVYEGHSILILRGMQPGALTVTATGEGLQTATAGLRVMTALQQGLQRSF